MSEQALCAEVINQQVRDLCAAQRAARSAQRAVCQAAEAWVGVVPSRQFRTVCALADLDVDRAHRRFREIVATPWEARRAMLGFGAYERRAA